MIHAIISGIMQKCAILRQFLLSDSVNKMTRLLYTRGTGRPYDIVDRKISAILVVIWIRLSDNNLPFSSLLLYLKLILVHRVFEVLHLSSLSCSLSNYLCFCLYVLYVNYLSNFVLNTLSEAFLDFRHSLLLGQVSYLSPAH